MSDRFSLEDINSMNEDLKSKENDFDFSKLEKLDESDDFSIPKEFEDNNSDLIEVAPESVANDDIVDSILKDEDRHDDIVDRILNVDKKDDNIETTEEYDGPFHPYKCKECGLSFATKNDSKKKCPNCGGIYLEKTSIDLNDVMYMPFSKTKEDAKKAYKKLIFNPLIPFCFKNKTIVNSIEMVYVPCFLSNISASGDVIFLAGDREKGNGVVKTKKYKVSYNTNFDFNNVCISLCSRINNGYFEEINNYDYTKLVSFDDNSSDMENAIIYKDDVLESSIDDLINSRVLKYSNKNVKNLINHELKKIDSNSVNIETRDKKKVLLPAYVLNVKYKGNDYLYIMNADTGKSYLSKVFSKTLLIVYSVVLFLIIFLIAYLIAYFF